VMLFHGVVVGLLFGAEFACIYFGMLYTDAARSVLFVYLSPFVVAAGAHFFLKGDRLTFLKTAGLVLAFTGIFAVFGGRPKTAKASMLLGDVLEIAAAFLWRATTLYIKKFMANRVEPIHTFLYQLFFSIPILLIVSIVLEPTWIYKINFYIVASLFYQSVIVAFITYLVWFKLIHEYSVSRLSAFTFFTPIFGVLFGILLLHEEMTISLMIGLPLVSMGIFMVNWRRRTAI
jgi:drug/metabolite transporter (DMT)-like permease